MEMSTDSQKMGLIFDTLQKKRWLLVALLDFQICSRTRLLGRSPIPIAQSIAKPLAGQTKHDPIDPLSGPNMCDMEVS